MAASEICVRTAPKTMAHNTIGISVSNSTPNIGTTISGKLETHKLHSGSRTLGIPDPCRKGGASRPTSRNNRQAAVSSRCSSTAGRHSVDSGQKLHEKELFSKFRNVYAGKGGWLKGSNAPTGSGGNVPLWSPAGQRYKQEILKKLAISFSKKDGVTLQTQIGNNREISKSSVEVIHQNHRKQSQITSCLSSSRHNITISSPGIGRVISAHNHAKQIPLSCAESKETCQPTHETVVAGRGLKSVDDCSSKERELQKGNGYGLEDAKLRLTTAENSINSDVERSSRLPQKIGGIDITDKIDSASPVASAAGAVRLGAHAESTDSRKSLRQDTVNQEVSADIEHGQSKLVKHTSTDNSRAITDVCNNDKETLDEKVKNNQDSDVRCLIGNDGSARTGSNTRASVLGVDTGVCGIRRSRSGDIFRRATPSASGRHGGARSAGTRDNRMTLFAQLSVEAQRALDETREEMVSSERSQSTHADDKDKDISNTDNNEAVADNLTDTNKLLVQQVNTLHCSSVGSSPEPADSVRDMDLTNDRFPVSTRERELHKSRDLSRFHSVHARGYHKSTKPRGQANNGAPDFSPRAKAKPQRLKATHGLGESPIRHSQQVYPRKDSFSRSGRLPQITSIDTSKLPRESELPWNSNHDFRIPNVGQYRQPTLAQRMLTREQSFQITPFGYDSRIADMPMMVPEEEDDTPNEVKAQAIEKCSEWMKKYM